MIKLKVSKEKLLQWYADNNAGLTSKQVKAAINDDWNNFIDCNSANEIQKSMFKNYFEYPDPEPNYKDWIGEDCVFSDYPFDDIINCEAHEGILICFENDKFINNIQDVFSYCMLKKDYVKLIKEQIK
jgi:hypothetical protein